MKTAVGYVASAMVRAQSQLLRTGVLLVRLLLHVIIVIILIHLTCMDLLLTTHGVADAMRVHTIVDHLFIQITRPHFVSIMMTRILKLTKVSRVVHANSDSASMQSLLLTRVVVRLD